MLNASTLRLILWVSCAHALVHVYEFSLPAVEQVIAEEYRPGDPTAGKRLTGLISTSWRLTWGLGALLVGVLVDRFGSRVMLAIYLLGCSSMCWLAATATPVWLLFGSMIVMGALASIYHPAGLALISQATTPQARPRALGIHGIFGSAGIGLTPIVVGLFFYWGGTWRDFYMLLCVPGTLLGLTFARQAMHPRRPPDGAASALESEDEDDSHWTSYFTLVGVAVMQGFIYSAMLSFLPRYLSTSEPGGDTSIVTGNNWAGPALLLGCVGQFLAGAFADWRKLERQLASITFMNVPPLLWMAVAQGWQRPVAAGLFALIHFMHQPIYNSLIAKYTSRTRRSLCYGFSFAMGLGIGGIGASFNGFSSSDTVTYGVLAGVAVVAGCGCVALMAQNRRFSGTM